MAQGHRKPIEKRIAPKHPANPRPQQPPHTMEDFEKFKIGERVIVEEESATAFGYKPPCCGEVIGMDPRGVYNDVIRSVRIDGVPFSVFETKGIHIVRLKKADA